MTEEQKRESMGGGMGRTCMCGGSCTCGCGCGWPRGHRAFRVILGIVILLVVFWVGVKAGEIREAFGMYGYGGGYAHHGMMMYGGNGYYGGGSTVIPAHPITPVTTTSTL